MPGSFARPGAVILGSDFKALGVVRSLGRRGIPSVLVDDVPRSAWFSRYVIQRRRWPKAMWGPIFVDYLIDLARADGLEGWLLIPLQDEVVELVARNAGTLATIYRLVTPPWDRLRWAHDKRLAYQVAAEVGIACPTTWYPTSEAELTSIDFPFPVIVKPAVSIRLQYATGRKALVARDRAELVDQYRVARTVVEAGELMIQQVIPGDGQSQFSVGAFCQEGTAIAAMSARRTRQYPVDYGLSSSLVEAVDMPDLIELAGRLLRRFGLTGMLEVEFKRDRRDGRYKFLDINVRPWGWHTLCIACGLDFPYAQYRHALGEPVSFPTPRYGRRWRRLITDLPAGIQEIRRGWTTPARFLRSLLGSSVGSVFDWRDPLPALGDTAVCLARLARPGKRHAPMAAEPATLATSDA